MTYRVKIAPRALKSLAKVPEPDQTRVRHRIRLLAEEPRPRGVEKIKGREDLYRIRAGDYRVLYEVEDDVLFVLVVRVGHRKDVYRKMGD
ncbi:MAG TPA: type II toxin-antitoxin system RelE/ParE family toxin [bacterium]|nr:type II toxin-antitoxin system RelE/ParE family toxin [bacterium]